MAVMNCDSPLLVSEEEGSGFIYSSIPPECHTRSDILRIVDGTVNSVARRTIRSWRDVQDGANVSSEHSSFMEGVTNDGCLLFRGCGLESDEGSDLIIEESDPPFDWLFTEDVSSFEPVTEDVSSLEPEEDYSQAQTEIAESSEAKNEDPKVLITKKMQNVFSEHFQNCESKEQLSDVEKETHKFLEELCGEDVFLSFVDDMESSFQQKTQSPFFCQKFFAASVESKWTGIAREYLKAKGLLQDLSLPAVMVCLRDILEMQHKEEKTLNAVFKQVCRTKAKLTCLELLCDEKFNWNQAVFFEKAAVKMVQKEISESTDYYVLPAGFAAVKREGVLEPGHAMFVVFIKRGDGEYDEVIINAQASKAHGTCFDETQDVWRQNLFSLRKTPVQKLEKRLANLLKWGNSRFAQARFEEKPGASFSVFERRANDSIYAGHGKTTEKDCPDPAFAALQGATIKVQGEKNNCAWLSCVGLISLVLRLEKGLRNTQLSDKGKPLVEKALVHSFREALLKKVKEKTPNGDSFLLTFRQEPLFSYKPISEGFKALAFDTNRLSEEKISCRLKAADFCQSTGLTEDALQQYREALREIFEQGLRSSENSSGLDFLSDNLLSYEPFLHALLGILEIHRLQKHFESFKRLMKQLKPYEKKTLLASSKHYKALKKDYDRICARERRDRKSKKTQKFQPRSNWEDLFKKSINGLFNKRPLPKAIRRSNSGEEKSPKRLRSEPASVPNTPSFQEDKPPIQMDISPTPPPTSHFMSVSPVAPSRLRRVLSTDTQRSSEDMQKVRTVSSSIFSAGS